MDMKTLKVILVLALVFTAFTSCTKQDLNEDDVLTDTTVQYTGGDIKER
ncbi:hypothetical protein [Snuella sedimenti]|uniref:Uncharacterized protein n=1 Tax=Snuella sedimenti TaxID=2798802 RepID=A0A8J7ITL6_9FLAO|nr:hypothetical protein [Snuella sedimenti]MBJ6367760.1 hypothetical protein [Snuella sedimenti]